MVGGSRARDLAPTRPRLRLPATLLGLRRGVSQPVEEQDLLLGVTAHIVLGRQVCDELTHARTQLVREVRRRRADEPVDVVSRRLHGADARRRRLWVPAEVARSTGVASLEPFRAV